MKRLRAAAAVGAVAVVWLGYWVAVERANQRERRAAAVAVPVVALTEPGPSGGKVLYRPRKETPEQIPGAPGASRRSPKLARALPAKPWPVTTPVPAEGPAIAAATPHVDPLSDSPAHVPFLQSALSESRSDMALGAHGRPGGVLGGAAIPSMWGFGGGGTGSAHAASPVATNDAPVSGDSRVSVLGHRFAADSGESDGSDGSNGTTGDTGSNGNTDSNGGAGSNGGGGSNDGGGSNGGGGSNDSNQGGGGSNGGDSNGAGDTNQSGGGTGDGGGDQGGTPEPGIQSLAVNVQDEDQSEDVPDVPEPGSILVAIGVTAAIVRRARR